MAGSQSSSISPLIATALLIVFSFILGAVVLSWGEGFVEARASFVNTQSDVDQDCTNIDLSLVYESGKPFVCFKDTSIETIIDNKGREVASIQVKLISKGGVEIIENVLATPLGSGETRKITIPHRQDVVLEARLTPIVRSAKGQQICSTNARILKRDSSVC